MDKQYNSATIQIYYKGFSILLTERGEGKPMSQVFTSAIKLVEEAIAANCVPSWNPETNKANGAGSTRPVSTIQSAGNARTCPLHNVLMYEREGKFGPFYSHKTDEYQADGKPKWCNGYPKGQAIPTKGYNMPDSS